MTFAHPEKWRLPLQKHGLVIVYDEIGNVPVAHLRDHRLFVPPALFEAQLAVLKEIGVQTSLQMDGSKEMPGKAFLTFDDASTGLFRFAMPALKGARYQGVTFVVCDAIGKRSTWDLGTPRRSGA